MIEGEELIKLQILRSAQNDRKKKGERRLTASGAWRWFPLVLIAAISIVEWVFTYANSAWAIGFSLLLTLAIYTLISLVRLEPAMARAAESLVIVPLYILFTSSLPWFFLQQDYLLSAVYSIILILILWHILGRGLSLKDLGIKWEGIAKYVLLGFAVGIPAGVIEYLILTPPPPNPTFEIKYLLRDTVYMFFFVALAEELLCRGLIQPDLIEAVGKIRGILLAAALFAVMHLTWRSVPELFFVFAIGLVLGIVYHRTRSMPAVIIIHTVGNVVLVSVMPYLIR